MSWLDLLLAFIIVSSFVMGVMNGFAQMALRFAGTLAALFLGVWFYPVAAQILAPFIQNPVAAKFAGFFLIFVSVQIIASLAAWGVSKAMKATGLGGFDRMMGAAFGLLRGMVVATILVMVIMAFPFRPVASAVAGSQISPYLLGIANTLTAMAPQELRAGFEATYEQVKKLWGETVGQTPIPRAEN